MKLLVELTASDVDEVVPGGFVDLNVAGSDVVLVAFEGHIAVFFGNESHESLAVPTSLGAQTQRNASPVISRRRTDKWTLQYKVTHRNHFSYQLLSTQSKPRQIS